MSQEHSKVPPQIDPLPAGVTVKVLIVDDEPVNRKVLENHLSLAGYQVIQASNGMEALDILKEEKDVDLLILDIMMPKMSGYEVCKHLRKLFLPSELPVVMLTAKNRISNLVEGFEVGANDYLTKPFSKEELLTRIRTHLRLHRIHQATGNFVPYEFLRSIGRDSITEVQLGDQVEQDVSVVFSDIRNYTGLAETMSPEETFKFVNGYVGRMGPVIQDHGGFVNQYLGDGIMAIFQQSAEQALRSGIEMHKVLDQYNGERVSKDRSPIKIGVGIHSGPLIMGIIGDKKRKEATTIADSVNTASRMEGLTKTFGASPLISEATYQQLPNPDAFHLRFLGPVQVKGKSESVGIYECFDGDPEEVRARKAATLSEFNQAMEYYLAQNFEQSAIAFKQIHDQNPADEVVSFFLSRSALYLVNGVPDNWAGVELMQGK